MTETERVDCTDCFALLGPDNTRIAYVKTGGGISETWHTPDRPALAITQINMEEGSKRVRERDTWARGVFPAAHERLKAAAALPADTAAQPFVDALSELVQAQADTTGIVVLHRWAEILERHFPPELPDPGRTTKSSHPGTPPLGRRGCGGLWGSYLSVTSGVALLRLS